MVKEELSPHPGLTEDEVRIRILQEGYNEIEGSDKQNLLTLIHGVVTEPMFLLLVGAGLLYLFLGDIQEALMLMSFVIVIIAITMWQEYKTAKTLESLRTLSSPRALVIRDGEPRRISGREVVRDDILILSEGDRVSADGILLESRNLFIDESLLTGESVPVRKIPSTSTDPADRDQTEDQARVFAGTLVVSGQGTVRITATGSRTGMGLIGTMLGTVERAETRLKVEITALVKVITLIAGVLCLSVVLIFGFRYQDWIQGMLAGITLAMAILPEEFPVVLTVFLALGAWRMARKKILTRQIPAIETLGSATVLCVDKTGTITENRMSVRSFYTGGSIIPCRYRDGGFIDDECHELVEYGILACRQDPFDPMEKALRELAEGEFGKTEHNHRTWKLVREYPLSDDLLAMSNVWSSPDGRVYIVSAKGAPEAIADLCHLPADEIAELSAIVDMLASEGLRVLGVARSAFPLRNLPTGQHDFRFLFLGLIGFADPVRAGIREAIDECHTAGIRVVMITGDYPLTARSIAREIGLSLSDGVITGPELSLLTDEELAMKAKNVQVFARTVPEQKLRIVQALTSAGEVVAMTGDGVNDAPALRAADIGIAMGMRGTDVAREAASLVLLDDNFTSIVSAVRMGRRIFDNLRKAVAYIISIHVPIAGLSLLPVLVGWPLILLPSHVVFLELIIDPTCSVVFESEPEENRIMEKPPRSRINRLFSTGMLGMSLIQGLWVLAVLCLLGILARKDGAGADEIRTLLFATLVISNFGLMVVNRSWSEPFTSTLKRENRALWFVSGGTVLFLILVLTVPVLRILFNFTPLTGGEIMLSILAGAISVLWFEVYKVWKRPGQEIPPGIN